jgi:hypothetical protein
VGIGAQKLDTIESHPARLREDAQQPDVIAGIPLRHCALRATTGCLRRNSRTMRAKSCTSTRDFSLPNGLPITRKGPIGKAAQSATP